MYLTELLLSLLYYILHMVVLPDVAGKGENFSTRFAHQSGCRVVEYLFLPAGDHQVGAQFEKIFSNRPAQAGAPSRDDNGFTAERSGFQHAFHTFLFFSK